MKFLAYAYLKLGLHLYDVLGPDVQADLVEGLLLCHLTREVSQDPNYINSNQNKFPCQYLEQIIHNNRSVHVIPLVWNLT